ncbi:hypothetical protein HDU98_006415 [Podochytrium sp. JEL0797]|nr:hypothetical protein HDU98_006415 [Podochytrium sp. JEL0797]
MPLITVQERQDTTLLYPWPNPKFSPTQASNYSYNEITIHAPTSTIWHHLTHPHAWPTFYSDMAIRDSPAILSTTPSLSTKENRMVRNDPVGEGKGVTVVTEEGQTGVSPSVASVFAGIMEKRHQEWLEGLKRVSEAKQEEG